MSWDRELWQTMVTKGAKGGPIPWDRAPQSSGAGRNGLKQNLSLNPQRFINDRLSTLSQNTVSQAVNALGINNVNSMNDVNQIFDWVNGGGMSKKKEETQNTPTVDDPNKETGGRNEPTVNYDPTTIEVEGVAGTNQQSNVKPDTSASGYDPNNISSFAGRADRFGMKDLKAAFQSGYSQSDVMQHLNSMSPIDGSSGGYLAGGAVEQGLRETAMGQISTQFLDPTFNPWGSAGWDKARNTFGHMDLLANRKAGFSDTEILNWLDNNLDKLNPGQRKGVSGGIYETLNAMRPTEPIAPKSLMVGSANLGNSGYADAVKPNRSSASSSTRSSYGTSQFNRNNFGNKKRSGITVQGLNI